jgi:hypothetical protein
MTFAKNALLHPSHSARPFSPSSTALGFAALRGTVLAVDYFPLGMASDGKVA